MANDEPKTKLTKASVAKFIAGENNASVRDDCRKIVALMKKITKTEPKMWGPNIIGFGKYCYIYANGRENDWPLTAFAPRKQNLTVYMMPGFKKYTALLNKLGKHSTSKSCLYFKSLNDIDVKVLEQLIKLSIKDLKQIMKEKPNQYKESQL